MNGQGGKKKLLRGVGVVGGKKWRAFQLKLRCRQVKSHGITPFRALISGLVAIGQADYAAERTIPGPKCSSQAHCEPRIRGLRNLPFK